MGDSLRGMRIGFAGTPEFAAVALRALCEASATVPLVLTQPDRPAGRGMKLQASAVKLAALERDLAVHQPTSLRLDGKYPQEAAAAQAVLQAAQLDALVVAAYGLILPQWVLDTPRWGCLNIHASLLPRWRGAAPIHRAIEAGDAESGVTIMQMDAGLDTGDMLAMARTPLAATETTASLHDRLATLGADLTVQVLRQAGARPRTPQPADGITYARKIDKAESTIDWQRSAADIDRQIRAFNPNPGAHTLLNGDLLKMWNCYVFNSNESPKHGDTGLIVFKNEQGIGIQTGSGQLVVTQLQRAGGKRQSAAQLANAPDLQPGQRLG